jgi:uncharacterized cupin superfamily protein
MTDLVAERARWRQISPAWLRGEGLAPYPATGFAGLFDWSERTDAGSTHVMAYEGQFLVDVVEIEDNAVHQPSKPADEIVCILGGVLTLTTDGVADEQIFRKGEFVLIPAGWAGIYRVGSEDGPFRELCIVPWDYFDPATVPAPSGLVPRRIDTPIEPGSHLLLDRRYTIEAIHDDAAQEIEVVLNSDVIIRVLDGELTLRVDGNGYTYAADSFIVLRNGFAGTIATTAGYQAIVASWLG